MAAMSDRAQHQQWLVRPPGPCDRGRWKELYDAYARFYGVDSADEPGGGERGHDRATTVWGWLQDPGHEVAGLLVEDARGHVVGLAHYRPFARPLAASTGCHLDDLFVDPVARGAGAVDALLAELRRVAALEGWSVVRWITADDNYRGRAVYDRHATRTTWITYDMTP